MSAFYVHLKKCFYNLRCIRCRMEMVPRSGQRDATILLKAKELSLVNGWRRLFIKCLSSDAS